MTAADGDGTVRAFGDSALVVDVADVAAAHALRAALLRRIERAGDDTWAGLEEIVVGFDTLTVIADPVAADLHAMADDLASSRRWGAAGTGPGTSVGGRGPDRAAAGTMEIPVVFDGPDLSAVAEAAHTTEAGVVDMLTGAELTVAFVGFAPGFAYLHGLPAPLAGLARRSTARPSVPAGAVALAGGFAAVYPQASPGGWQLVGRSHTTLFRPDRAPYAVLQPGDRVRFTVDPDAGRRSDSGTAAGGGVAGGAGGRRRPLEAATGRALVVEEPGPLSLVQDRGRIGVAHLGVPRAGAADPDARRVANRLVGNAEEAAVLEITVTGPTLRFETDAYVAVIGDVAVTVDGLRVPVGTVVPVSRGQRLSMGAVGGGARAVLAVGGGFDTPAVLGSRSSDVLCGLGPGPLQGGDVLGVGAPVRPHGDPAPPPHAARPDASRTDAETVLRVVAGPDHLDAGALARVTDTTWRVATDSNRIGVRLVPADGDGAGDGARAGTADAARTTSRAMITGAVQLPPDGRPIVLGCDHATVGGFPIVATVVSVDHGRLGQCRPGQRVRLALVDQAEAGRRRRELERAIAAVGSAWYPVESG